MRLGKYSVLYWVLLIIVICKIIADIPIYSKSSLFCFIYWMLISELVIRNMMPIIIINYLKNKDFWMLKLVQSTLKKMERIKWRRGMSGSPKYLNLINSQYTFAFVLVVTLSVLKSICGVISHFRSGADGIQIKWVSPGSRGYVLSIVLQYRLQKNKEYM